MILDAIIALIFGLVGATIAAAAAIINLIAAAIEGIVSIFIDGFTLGRIRPRNDQPKKPKPVTRTQLVLCAISWLVILSLLLGLFVIPKIREREITFIAKDGHPLPFAAVLITTKNSTESRRTDTAGNLKVPRFGLQSVTLKDPRYIQTTWSHPNIKSPLEARRTILGSSLDKFADKLLRPADE